jgi:hypothetical protein
MPEWHEQFRQAEVARVLINEADQRWRWSWRAPAWIAIPNWSGGLAACGRIPGDAALAIGGNKDEVMVI